MNNLIIFTFILASAYGLSTDEIKPRQILLPAGLGFGMGRITNGRSAVAGQIPYQVNLLLKRNNLKYFWCGGSLISHQWVLTAAHCTEGAVEVTVFLGSTIRSSSKVKHKVTKQNIIIHSGYNAKTLKNDISLIKIPFTKYSYKIQPVKLPASNSSKYSHVGKNVIASGWGEYSDITFGGTEYLQWARMKIISNSDCARFVNITSTNICIATTGGISTCNGDSGGPLVLESTKVLIGVTSYGRKTACTRGIPEVFTRVDNYLDWIRAYTGTPT